LISRAEFNYPIPDEDAEALLGSAPAVCARCGGGSVAFELDHFRERDLWLAEIELADERERFQRPPWLGDEVTNDPEYANSRLATPRSAS